MRIAAYLLGTLMVGLGGLEPPTSPLSGARSSHLSYRPNGGNCRETTASMIAVPRGMGQVARGRQGKTGESISTIRLPAARCIVPGSRKSKREIQENKGTFPIDGRRSMKFRLRVAGIILAFTFVAAFSLEARAGQQGGGGGAVKRTRCHGQGL